MFNLKKCAFGTGNGEYYTGPFSERNINDRANLIEFFVDFKRS